MVAGTLPLARSGSTTAPSTGRPSSDEVTHALVGRFMNLRRYRAWVIGNVATAELNLSEAALRLSDEFERPIAFERIERRGIGEGETDKTDEMEV